MNRSAVWLAAFIVLSGTSTSSQAALSLESSSATERRVEVKTYASGPRFSVNAYLVVSDSGLVLVDTMRTRADVAEVINAIRQFDVPLKAVLLTHTHPDHIGGLGAILEAFPGVEIVASEMTRTDIRDDRTGMISSGRQFVPGFGPDVPAPTRIVANGETFTLAGVEYAAKVWGPGEAEGMTLYQVDALKAVFIGDIAGDGTTPWLVEGRSAAWLAQVDQVAQEFSKEITLYPGHGPTGKEHELLRAQSHYLTTLRALVIDRTGDGQLDDKERQQVIAAMAEKFRFLDTVAPMPNLEQANVDAVAQEILRDSSQP